MSTVVHPTGPVRPQPGTTYTGATIRIASVDIIRGAVMALMAIDHVRVYSGVPAGGPTFDVFFTRWITHFCAPAFLFLAGTSAFLYRRTHDDLSRHLLIRGAWLIVLELTVLRVAWTFNFDFAGYEMAGVIWVIGWCMILMAGLTKLPIAAVGTIGVLIIAGHNLVGPSLGAVISTLDSEILDGLWKILYLAFFDGPIRFGENGPSLIVLYSIVPWIGVMAAGYAFGAILTMAQDRRRRWCLTIGLGAIATFVALRAFNLYGDPQPWTDGTLTGFLNTSKYPASLLFLLMTLGPTIASIPLVEGSRGALSRWLTVFGRVPLFYYVAHIPLIHALAVIVSTIRLGTVSPWLFANHPMGSPPPPDGYAWSLPLLYLTWGVAIAMLYVVCRWFGDLKTKRVNVGILRYL
jgi:uncharacterized membrane protein